jgi:uncharacterized protein (DUF433 family)
LNVEQYVNSVVKSQQAVSQDVPKFRWLPVLVIAVAVGVPFGIWFTNTSILAVNLDDLVRVTGWPPWLVIALCRTAGALLFSACFLPGAVWWVLMVQTVRNLFRSLQWRLGGNPPPEPARGGMQVGTNDRAAALQGQLIPMAVRITKTPGVCRGQACIRGTTTTVWKIVQWRRRGKSDAWLLARFPWLVPADLPAAWNYAAALPEEIEATIRSDDQRLTEKNNKLVAIGGLMLAVFGFALGGGVGNLVLGLERGWVCGLFGVIAVLGIAAWLYLKTPKWQRQILWLGGFLGVMLPLVCGVLFAAVVTMLFGKDEALSSPQIGGVATLPGMVIGTWLAARYIRRWEAEP